LVILDIMMPKVDGYEVCKYIKTKYPQVLVMFLTAKSKQQDKQKGLEAGADLYLTKPFSTKDLAVKVREILRK
jgi:DNA-binding response OmpR family regulator